MSTEIYICKAGQALKEGKLEYSDAIEDKESAEADAKTRCRRDATIHKVAYYALSPSGSFRCFYTYTNPDCGKPQPKPGAAPKPKPKAKPAKKPGVIERVLSVFKK